MTVEGGTPAEPTTQRKHAKLVKKLVLISVLMLGFGYALVPLYNVLCKATGLNGKTGGPSMLAVKESDIDLSREVTVRFVTTNNQQLPWVFYPMTETLQVHPGESHLVRFYVKNDTKQTMVVQAIPSVTPGQAANYLKKTECFCFRQQELESGQSKRLPLLFHLDPALPKDVSTVILSYTLFNAEQFKKPSNQTEGKLVS